MSAGLFGTQASWIPAGARLAGLAGLNSRGTPVYERLDLFVSTALAEESADASDLDYVRLHNAKVRESVKGSVNLTKRLNGESDEESEPVRAPERPIKGEAFMAKMIQLRMRRTPA